MNKRPTFTANGYPSVDTKRAIKKWDFRDASGWLQYIREAWDHRRGEIWEENGRLYMTTGGWSGNEEIISAMSENLVLWGMFWESSHRGGLDVFNAAANTGLSGGRPAERPESSEPSGSSTP